MSRKTIFSLICLALAAAPLTACNGEEERPEQVDKLRALGVAPAPFSALPSTAAAPQTVTLTVYAAVPPGETVTAAPFDDEQARYAVTTPVTIKAGSEHYEDHAGFRVFSVQADAVVPDAETLQPELLTGLARVRYGILLTSGGEEEEIVGNFLVYPPGADALTWAAPAVDITSPAPSATISGTEDVTAAITNPIGENMRVGWYVDDGKIKNRRARETEWETPGSGQHTLVVTIRGLKSGAFALKAIDVTVD